MTYQQSTSVVDYLTVKPLVTYPKGQRVYMGTPDSLYMVIAGRIRVSRGRGSARNSVIKIVGPNGLFGESCLTGEELGEEATALSESRIMAWKRAEIERLIEGTPMLGVALMREVIDTLLGLQDRLEVGATCKMRDRLMFTLIQLAQASAPEAVGSTIRMPPLNHRTIAGHVGTTRGIITTQMGRLRSLGLLTYSRRHIEIDCEAITKVLSSHGVRVGRRTTAADDTPSAICA